MKSIRCGRGLGDSVYLQSVVRHLISKTGEQYEVASDYPDVFLPLGDKVKVVEFRRQKIDILAHYASRKAEKTTQFTDCCINAGLSGVIELRLDWPQASGELIDRIKASGKPIVIVQLPRAPMGRTDGYGKELLPDCKVIQKFIDALKEKATIVQVGAGDPLFNFTGIDIDLANKTTVRELLDVCSVADRFIGYCSFILAIAESFHKPTIMVWSRNGLNSKELYVRQITPEKIIEHRSTRYVIDDCGDYEIERTLDGFL